MASEEKETAAGQPPKAEASVEQTPVPNEEPYSIYTPGQKKAIVLAASMASLLSPFTANMYFPALNVIAHDLDVSTSLVNLTVTTYLVRYMVTLFVTLWQ